MKTNRGAAKRFSRSASGKFKHRQSHRSHILTKKSTKRYFFMFEFNFRSQIP